MCALKSRMLLVTSNTSVRVCVPLLYIAINSVLVLLKASHVVRIFFRYRSSHCIKRFTTYYFAKRDAGKTICEKITRLNILWIFMLRWRYFWHQNEVGLCPSKCSFGGGGLQPRCPPAPPAPPPAPLLRRLC